MATIEERAMDYAEIAKIRGDMPLELAEEVYIEIATEQKMIDINKACEWITKEWAIHDCDAFTAVSRLRKAMDE